MRRPLRSRPRPSRPRPLLPTLELDVIYYQMQVRLFKKYIKDYFLLLDVIKVGNGLISGKTISCLAVGLFNIVSFL